MTAVTRQSGQGIARFALALSLLGGVGALAGCAASSPSASAPEETIDAVLPVGDGFRVFQLGTLRHAKVPGNPEAWAGGTPAVTPAFVPSREDSSGIAPVPAVSWRKLATPAGAFRPVQAVPAQRGYFLLVDAASARLCLYDEAAGLLSTFPLPEAFTPFPAGRAAVFRGADGAFTFVDYAAGEASQFADRQVSGAGTTQWVSRGWVKLPAGARGCMQPPGSEELFCRGGDGSPLRFDGALNRVPAHLPQDTRQRDARADSDSTRRAAAAPSVSAAWDAGIGAWILEGRVGGGEPLFRYLPAQRRWLRVAPFSAAPADAP